MKKAFYLIFAGLLGFGCLTTWCFYWIINDPSIAYSVLYKTFSKSHQLKTSLKELLGTNDEVLSITNRGSDEGEINVNLPPLPLNKSDVCPESRLPGLQGLMELNMTMCTMQEAIDSVFTKQSGTENHIRELVQKAKQKPLNDLLKNNNYSEASMKVGFNYTLANYTYLPGGIWIPHECKPKWKVAVIIPFRDRHDHLPNLLRHLVPMLMKQRLEFGLFIVNQANTDSFNRAMLFNVGFIESLKFNKWDCFVFHDVDTIPENDYNYYGCGLMPRHFLKGIDKYGYWMPHDRHFGGVSGISREQFLKINGATNIFWGWGGEDDDLIKRLFNAGYSVTRPTGDIGHYKSMDHYKQGTPLNTRRFGLLRKVKERNFVDGLNTIDYKLMDLTQEELYVNVSADIHRIDLKVQLEDTIVDKYFCNNCF